MTVAVALKRPRGRPRADGSAPMTPEPKQPPAAVDRLLYTVAEATAAGFGSHSHIYAAAAAGHLKLLKALGRTVIHRDELARYAASLPAAPIRPAKSKAA